MDTNLGIGNKGQIIPSMLLLAEILSTDDTVEAAKVVEEILPTIDNSYGSLIMKAIKLSNMTSNIVEKDPASQY